MKTDLPESAWTVLILAGSAAVLLFSVYCLSQGITIIFMHLYYFPILLLAYRYRYRGLIPALLLSLAYVGLVYYFYGGQADVVTGAWYRFLVFAGIAAVAAYLSEQLAGGRDSLQESEGKYRAFFTTSMDCAFITTPDGRWVDFNDAAVGFFGYADREELRRVKVSDLYADPADRKQHIRYISEKGYSFEYPVTLKKKDGTIIRTLITSVLRRDDKGNITGFQGTIRDITEWQRTQENLNTQFRFLQQLIDTIPNPVFYKDRDGIYTGCNTAFEKYIGLPKDRLIGKSVYDIAPKDLADNYDAADKKILDNPGTQTYESRVKYADGSLHDVIFNKATFTDTGGRVGGLVGVILDITERKKAEEEERLARERFETLLKVSTMRDENEQELSEYVMQAACRMTGSTHAFIGTMNADESVMDIIAWSESAMQDCRIATSPIHFPIEKAGIWADAVRARAPKIVNEYPAPHPGKKGLPEGHVTITRFLSIPILDHGKVVMVAAVANKPDAYDDADVTRLTLLMQGVWGNLEERRAGEALRKSETLLSETGEMAKVGGWEIDVQTKEVRMTRETYRIHEIPEGEPYDLPRAARFFDMPGWSVLEAALQRCMEHGEPFDLELPFTTAKGRHLWTRAIGRAVIAGGRTVQVRGTFQDITDRKRAEESVRKSLAILKGVVESPKDVIIFALDCQYRYIAFNENHRATMKRIWGADIALGNSMPGYIRNTDDRKKAVANFDRALAKESFTVTEAYGDTAHERRWYDDIYNPIIDENGNVIGLTLFLTDITVRKQAEEALRESRQILEGILNTIPVRVFWKDKNLVYLGCNTPFARDAGYEKPEDLIGKDDYAMGWREQAELYRADDRNVIGTGVEKHLFEEPQTTPSGETIHLLTSKIPLRDAGGNIIGVLGTYLDITAHRRVEEALRESEKRFREIFDNANDAIEIVDLLDSGLPGRFLDLNNVACRMLGYSKEELLQKSPLEIDSRNFDRPFDQIIREIQSTGHATFETEHVRKDKTLVPVEINTHRITLLGRTVLISITRDVSERKEAEEALRESEIRFRELFNSMSSGVAVYRAVDDGTDFTFVDFNRGAEIIDRIPKQDVIGRRVTEVFPGVGEFGILDVFRRVWQSGIPEHHPAAIYRDERIASWRDNYVYRLPSGEVVAIYDDVTARRQAETALLESEQKFRDIFNNTTDAIHIHEIRDDGTPGTFTDVNEVSCRMLGYTREELLTKTPLDIATTYHDPPVEKILEEQRTRGEARFETGYRTKDGRVIPVEINTHLVTLQGKKVMLGVVRDITERKKTEALLRDFNAELEQQVAAQTEKINASLNEKVLLLREIHHRVKNNLQMIISLTNLQLRQIDDERLKQVMKETQNRVRAMSLVHEKLYQSEDIARINLADYTRFLTTQLFSFYGESSRNVKMHLDIGRIMLDINTAIPAGLIINELVSNALKHAFPKNRPGQISIAAREEGDTICLKIKDNGVGMPETFNWRDSPSLGLRLVVILVEQLNGTIERTPSAEGSVFVIRIRKAGGSNGTGR